MVARSFPLGSSNATMARAAVRRAIQHAATATRASMPHYRAEILAALEAFADSGDMAQANDLLANGVIYEWDPSSGATAITHALKGIYRDVPQADEAALAATRAREALNAFGEGNHWSVVVNCCQAAGYAAKAKHCRDARANRTYGSSASMTAGSLALEAAELAELATLGYVA